MDSRRHAATGPPVKLSLGLALSAYPFDLPDSDSVYTHLITTPHTHTYIHAHTYIPTHTHIHTSFPIVLFNPLSWVLANLNDTKKLFVFHFLKMHHL